EPVHEPVLVIPHHLQGELRVLRVDVRKRLPGDVVLHREAVRRELFLRRVLLGGFLVGLRPFHPFRLGDGDRETALDAPLEARRDEVLHLLHVAGVDLVARRHVRPGTPARSRSDGQRHQREPDSLTHRDASHPPREPSSRSHTYQRPAATSAATVNQSSVIPAFSPWLKYQPCSPGNRGLGSDAFVACSSCMSTMTMDGMKPISSGYWTALVPGTDFRKLMLLIQI